MFLVVLATFPGILNKIFLIKVLKELFKLMEVHASYLVFYIPKSLQVL